MDSEQQDSLSQITRNLETWSTFTPRSIFRTARESNQITTHGGKRGERASTPLASVYKNVQYPSDCLTGIRP